MCCARGTDLVISSDRQEIRGVLRLLDSSGTTVLVTDPEHLPLHLHTQIRTDDGITWFRLTDMRDDAGRYVYQQIDGCPLPTRASIEAGENAVH